MQKQYGQFEQVNGGVVNDLHESQQKLIEMICKMSQDLQEYADAAEESGETSSTVTTDLIKEADQLLKEIG